MQQGRRRAIDPAELEDPEAQVPVENEDLIREALAHRGTPYRYGGASRGGFDCSGFSSYVYRRTRGLNLPHSASAQARRGTRVAREDLRPGDLVFFGSGRRIHHVGIYLGNEKFIHAANRRSNVRIDSLATGWYRRSYVCARRLSHAPEALPDWQAELPPDTVPTEGAEEERLAPGAILLQPKNSPRTGSKTPRK